MSVKIIVDSTCDFEPEERQALGIEMIPLTVQFGEEIFRDGIDITRRNSSSGCVPPRNFPTPVRSIPPPSWRYMSVWVRTAVNCW